MADVDPCTGAKESNFFSNPIYRFHAVMQEVDLPLATNLSLNGVTNNSFVVSANDRLDRQAIRWRGLNHRHILGPNQREVERSRNRSRRKGQDIHQLELFLELFLVAHPESLLLVDNHQPQFLEFDIARDQPVSTDHNIDRSIAQSLNRLPLF